MEMGWSQKELGEKLGVGQGIVSHVECGRRQISRDMAIRLYSLDADRFPLEKSLSGIAA